MPKSKYKTTPKDEGWILEDLTAALEPSYLDFGLEDWAVLERRQSAWFFPEAKWGAGDTEPSKAERVASLRAKILAEHARGGKTIPQIIDKVFAGMETEKDWYADAVRLARMVAEREFVNIGVEAEKLPVYDERWLACADENPLVIYPDDNSEVVSEQFRTGNFLYHATNIHAAESIIASGTLAPSAKGIEAGLIQQNRTNSGVFAVSWSMNEVHAMPGTPHHLCGFVASPEELLKGNRVGIVPVDAAQAEVQIFDGSIDVPHFKHQYAQLILWRRAISEYERIGQTQGANFKDSNCVKTLRHWEKQYFKDPRGFRVPISLGGSEIHFDESLLDGHSTLAALIMGLAEGNDLKKLGITSAAEVFALLKDIPLLNDITSRLPEHFTEELVEMYNELEHSASPTRSFVSFDTENMFFLTTQKDFDQVWRYVISRSKRPPKGVILVDGRGARIPNFSLQKGLGDHDAITSAIRDVIPEHQDTFPWDSLLPRVRIAGSVRGATRMFVPADLTLRAKSLKLSDGQLVTRSG